METEIKDSGASSSILVFGITCVAAGMLSALVMAGWCFTIYLA